ncbi:MAG: hypothetical protein ABI577_01605 [bacterium]
MNRIKNALSAITNNQQGEEGHAYAWGGGGLLTVVLVVLLIILIF